MEATPSGHWQTQTLVHAVALDGTRAAMILDGPIDGITFSGFCEYFLAPALRPGDLVVLDNLSSHKTPAAETAVKAAGAKLVFLPPYSPDLNPIEKLFAKVKQLVRGLRPRNWREIIDAAKQVLLRITFDDIENAFFHCGYTAT